MRKAAERWQALGLREVLPWLLLGVLLLLTLVGALIHERAGWEGFVTGESTYVMQAESLLHDGDLIYSRADFDRFVAAHRADPTDLALVSGSSGRRIAFDRPFPYAMWLAPFLALWPQHGFAVANAVLLIAVAIGAGIRLTAGAGAAAPLWVAVLLFASVAFAYVPLATGDLFLMLLTATAFLLAVPQGSVDGEAAGRSWRWWVAGALLATLFVTDPLYLVLVLAALYLTPKPRRGPLLGGFLLAVALLIGVQAMAGGGLGFFGSERFRFRPETGYPLVDFAAAEWRGMLRRLSAFYWDGAARFSYGLDPLLWLWNVLYLLLGESIGLLPYFLPVLPLLFFGARQAGRRRTLLAAAVVWAVALLLFQPFDLFGGSGAIANRRFLPLYGAFWLLAGRQRHPLWALSAVVLAAPFLTGLWGAPFAAPPVGERGYRHVTPLARAVLPYETSQRWLPGGQPGDLEGLWVRCLSNNAWVEQRKQRLMIQGGGRAELLIASPEPMAALRLALGPQASSRLEVAGAHLGERLLLPDGGIAFALEPRGPTPRHALWWTPLRHSLYHVSLSLPDAGEQALALRLSGLYGE